MTNENTDAKPAAKIEGEGGASPGVVKHPKRRGNQPMKIAVRVKGKERVRVPDEHDVIWNDEIVFRSDNADEREAFLAKLEKGDA